VRKGAERKGRKGNERRDGRREEGNGRRAEIWLPSSLNPIDKA